MISNEEKLSALFDGELDAAELDELIDAVSDDPLLENKMSLYSLLSLSIADRNKAIPINKNVNKSFYNFWFSNSITAAASIALTLIVINNSDLTRMKINLDSANQIESAINSIEAKKIISQSEEFLTDHVMKVINDPTYMSNNKNLDFKDVGFKSINSNFIRGNENFNLRIEKKNLGIKQVKSWRYGNKNIFLVPLSDGRVITIYGNISRSTALAIAEKIK